MNPVGTAEKDLGYDAEARAIGSKIQEVLVILAGTAHRNLDGTHRQEIAAQCYPGEFLRLTHEPDNQFDENAVGVFRESGEQLGYLPRRFAAEMVSRMKQGFKHAAVMKGTASASTLHVNVNLATLEARDLNDVAIVLFIVAPDATTREWEDYYQMFLTRATERLSDQSEPEKQGQETAINTPKGKCEACGKSPRVLTRIESGQTVCRTCLRAIRGL